MKKYYFVTYQGINDRGNTVTGCTTLKVENSSISEICEYLAETHNIKSPAIILCLKDLSEKEYKMLSKKK